MTSRWQENALEFLVEFEIRVPAGTLAGELERRDAADREAAGRLADDGHLVGLWQLPRVDSAVRAVGLFRAETRTQLGCLLEALPLYDWARLAVTPLSSLPSGPSTGLVTSPAT
jgi:muconolactone delta-isomerase